MSPAEGRTRACDRSAAEERRARLLLRHRLAPAASCGDPVEAARAVVALHSTDAATVFLSTWARTRDFAPAHLERALYEERALVRMLGMRRTLWVVPGELAPVVDAACTRTVAARERQPAGAARRAERRRRGPDWLDRPGGGRSARGAGGPRRGVHVGPHPGGSSARDEAPSRNRHALGERGECRLAHPSAARGRRHLGARTAAWVVGQRAVPLGARPRQRPRRRRRRRPGGAPPPLASRVRAGHGPGHPLVDGLDGPRGTGCARRNAAHTSSSSTARPATSWPTTSSPSSRSTRRRRCCPRSIRP